MSLFSRMFWSQPVRALGVSPAVSRGARVAGLMALVLGLGACSVMPDRPVRPTQYDFGPGALTAPPVRAALGNAVLVIADLEPSGGLDSSSMVLYRLGYTGDQQLRPYAQARWTLPPAQLVRLRLRDHLSLQRAVMSPTEGAALQRSQGQSLRVLRLELEEFSQVFDQPQQSSALVRLRATLLDSRPAGETLLAQRVFVTRQAAPSPDAPGGVIALTQATDQLARDLAQWVDTAPGKP